MKFLISVVIISQVFAPFAFAQGDHNHSGTRRELVVIEGQQMEMEVKEGVFPEDLDFTRLSLLSKLKTSTGSRWNSLTDRWRRLTSLSGTIHESLESGHDHGKNFAAIMSHLRGALNIPEMMTKAVRFVNASNRNEVLREHVRNLLFISVFTHGYELSSPIVNYFAARYMGAGDLATAGAVAAGVVMAIPFLADWICFVGYGLYAGLYPVEWVVQNVRVRTMTGLKVTSDFIRLPQIRDQIMETVTDPTLSPLIRMGSKKPFALLKSEGIDESKRRLTYEDPSFGRIVLETESGLDGKIYLRRMVISEGIAKAWLASFSNNRMISELTGFRERLLEEFSAYGFSVRRVLKEALDTVRVEDMQTHGFGLSRLRAELTHTERGENPRELIHRFYVQGVGVTEEKMIALDLIPDSVHVSRAQVVYPWERLKKVASNVKCRVLSR